MNTELRYRTFDELLYEVGTDFVIYNNENMIEPAQLIKVAQRVNYDLGLRIHGTKEKILDVEHGKAKLPDDFYVLNYAFLCGEETITRGVISGRQTENVIVDYCDRCHKASGDCHCKTTYSVECKTGENIFVQVVEKRKTETRTYSSFERIGISPVSGKKDAMRSFEKTAYIKNGFIYVNFGQEKTDGPVYDEHPNYGVRPTQMRHRLFISYEGGLEDEDGNLLVLDHPMINEYYEYALKQRILENLYINGEDVVQKLQLIEAKLKPARNNALSIVNTPDFNEMYTLWKTNRKAMNIKYYDMFKSIEPF